MLSKLYSLLTNIIKCKRRKKTTEKPLTDFEQYLKKTNKYKPIHNKKLDIDLYPTDTLILITNKSNSYNHHLYAYIKQIQLKTQFQLIDQHIPSNASLSINTKKYYKKRYLLFSKYDSGIQIDEESWYSVAPEKIGEHIAMKYRDKIVMEGCCGVGGNAIQFGKYARMCYAVDCDRKRLDCLFNNAQIYQVDKRVQVVEGSFFDQRKEQYPDIDVVFLSPPWGGVHYNQDTNYDLYEHILYGLDNWISHAFQLSQEVVLFLPRNIRINQFSQILGEFHHKLQEKLSCVIQIEKLFLNNRSQGNIIYIKKNKDRAKDYNLVFPKLTIIKTKYFENFLDNLIENYGFLKTLNYIYNFKELLQQSSDDQIIQLDQKLNQNNKVNQLTQQKFGIILQLIHNNQQEIKESEIQSTSTQSNTESLPDQNSVIIN